MPKMKSHSGMKKRVKRTGTGKLVHRRGRRVTHLMQKKSSGRSRLDDSNVAVSKADAKKVRKLLGK
ncbi:MAG TPA: bL35 family ribosomal protein [Nocardioidaceae bacterium]|nr:bL35 family ribosomal protein [Nocardioidaceae bacterium]